MSRQRNGKSATNRRANTVIPGLYQLRIHLKRPVKVRVGALGRCKFAAGWYVYTGSARNGLDQRIRRHLRRDKKQHWHIDYLLAAADHIEAFVLSDAGLTECELHAVLTGGKVAVPGFGASDCRCPSHLAWFRRSPKIGLIPWELLGEGLPHRCPIHRARP